MKISFENIISPITSIDFSNEQKLRINIVKEHIDYLDNQIDKLNEIIANLIVPYESYINLLCTILWKDRNSAFSTSEVWKNFDLASVETSDKCRI